MPSWTPGERNKLVDLVIRRLSPPFRDNSNSPLPNPPNPPRLRGSPNTQLIGSIIFILVTSMAPNFCVLPLITLDPSRPCIVYGAAYRIERHKSDTDHSFNFLNTS